MISSKDSAIRNASIKITNRARIAIIKGMYNVLDVFLNKLTTLS